jgi:hypothetical protein
MRAKQIGTKQDRNAAKHTPKPRNNMPKLQKLLSKGHLIPIYRPLGGDLCLVGYRRKPSSRKSHQRPFMLQQPIVVGQLPTNPESKSPNPAAEESLSTPFSRKVSKQH